MSRRSEKIVTSKPCQSGIKDLGFFFFFFLASCVTSELGPFFVIIAYKVHRVTLSLIHFLSPLLRGQEG